MAYPEAPVRTSLADRFAQVAAANYVEPVLPTAPNASETQNLSKVLNPARVESTIAALLIQREATGLKALFEGISVYKATSHSISIHSPRNPATGTRAEAVVSYQHDAYVAQQQHNFSVKSIDEKKIAQDSFMHVFEGTIQPDEIGWAGETHGQIEVTLRIKEKQEQDEPYSAIWKKYTDSEWTDLAPEQQRDLIAQAFGYALHGRRPYEEPKPQENKVTLPYNIEEEAAKTVQAAEDAAAVSNMAG